MGGLNAALALCEPQECVVTPGAASFSIAIDPGRSFGGDSTFSNELDCTLRANPGAAHCTISGMSAAYLSVESGAVNRLGAGYALRVQ